MMRALLLVGVLATTALAQPSAPQSRGITAEPAPAPSTPPTAYPPPPPNAAPVYPSYEEPARRSDQAFIALGVLIGAGGDWIYGAYAGELGATLLPDPTLTIRARAFGTLYAGTMESDWNGDFWRYGLGAEGRMCSTHTCVFGGVDAGYQRLTLYDGSHDFVRSDTGLLVGPRIGFDFGGAIRARFALELFEQVGRHRSMTVDDIRRFETVTLSFALGYQL